MSRIPNWFFKNNLGQANVYIQTITSLAYDTAMESL
jgi:hypothetical protein